MAIATPEAREWLIDYLKKPLLRASTICTLGLLGGFGLGTDPSVPKLYAVAFMAAAMIATIAVIYWGVFRLSKASGRL